jgi:pimeloyl-ACP methyl ester carboxylesterase
VAIDAGGRLTGRIGKFSVGVLNIQTADAPSAGARATNFSVMRVRRDLLRRSSIGALFTSRSVSRLGTGSNEAYGVEGTTIYHRLAQQGYVVLAYDQCGFGSRLLEGRDFYKQHPKWSRLGRMVHDVSAAVDFLRDGKGAAQGKMPVVDGKQIDVLGYSLGGMVGLYATAMDDRISGVASFCGFTPLRTDTNDKPTGGNQRLYQWHALQPKLGLFKSHENEIPYDFDDILRLIAPRSCLIFAPKRDRHADFDEVAACVKRARATWAARGRGKAITHLAPDDINRFQQIQQQLFLDWLDDKGQPDKGQ